MQKNKLLIGIILVAFAFGARNGIRFGYLGPLTNTYTDSAFLITIILSLGTFLGIFLNPLIGKRSDRTWTRYGRRRPYLMVSLLISAFFTIFIPHSPNYTVLIVLVFLESFAIIVGFTPLFSLISDNFETEKRGKINAVLISSLGLGTVCSIGIGYRLWDINYYLFFYTVAGIIFAFSVASFFFIKENPFPEEILNDKSHSLIAYFKGVLINKPIILYYAGDFFRWFSLSLISQMVTLFAVNELGVTIGVAGQTVLALHLAKLFSSIPVGMATDKIDRKRFLLAGIILSGGALYYAWCVYSFVPLLVAMGLIGIAAAITVICGSSLLMDMFPKGRGGEFIGMNMVFGCIPTILSLWISGALIDMLGSYRVIFLVAIIATIISFIITAFIPTQNVKRKKLSVQI